MFIEVRNTDWNKYWNIQIFRFKVIYVMISRNNYWEFWITIANNINMFSSFDNCGGTTLFIRYCLSLCSINCQAVFEESLISWSYKVHSKKVIQWHFIFLYKIFLLFFFWKLKYFFLNKCIVQMYDDPCIFFQEIINSEGFL